MTRRNTKLAGAPIWTILSDNPMTPVPLAYKYVAIAMMMAEINYCANRLHLPMELPVKNSDIRAARVSDPRVRSRSEHRPTEYGFSGFIDTEKYSFSFPAGLFKHPSPGKLRYIIRLDSGYQAYSMIKTQGNLPTHEFLPQLVGIHSTIDMNEAYRIATNWLMAIDVDVQRLEKEQPVTVRQQSLRDYGPLPIFEVSWGGHPAIIVWISGDTKDLLRLRQEDDSYSKRPFTLIKDMDKLLAISDEEFQKYSAEERTSLVARFSGVIWPVPTNESHSLPSQTNAPAETNVPTRQ
jgi:hypothetical protein